MIKRSFTAAAIAMLGTGAPLAAQTFHVDKYNIGGDGGNDYITAEAGTGRVFISRGTHVMVVDGASGKVLGDIPNTPRVHGIGLASGAKHGFTTNGGDSTLTMFDLGTLAFVKKTSVKVGGLDGIMYDAASDRIILTNHSKPGTLVAVDPASGEITGTATLEDNAPEGAVSNGKGWIYVNNEGTSTMQVIEQKSMKALHSWPLAPCDGPTGIAYDKTSDRVFVGCSKTSMVVNGTTGKIVATITNGDGVDALGWDPSEKMLYLPAGQSGTVTVVHQDSPDKYTVVATVPTMRGGKTIAVDPATHRAYLFAAERGPATPAPAGSPAGTRATPGPLLSANLLAISH